MLKDGEYAVWFRTGKGQGTGQVFLREGRISGQDSFISYGGTYAVDGDRFIGRLTTRRHTEGPATVFGTDIDEVEVELVGTASGNLASCSGEVAAVPGMVLEIILIQAREEDRPRMRARGTDATHSQRVHRLRERPLVSAG